MPEGKPANGEQQLRATEQIETQILDRMTDAEVTEFLMKLDELKTRLRSNHLVPKIMKHIAVRKFLMSAQPPESS